MSIVNKKQIAKAKKKFSSNVAKMKPEEVFGMKPCGVNWNQLFKDDLILNYIDIDCFQKEPVSQCLIGKMSSNCNC